MINNQAEYPYVVRRPASGLDTVHPILTETVPANLDPEIDWDQGGEQGIRIRQQKALLCDPFKTQNRLIDFLISCAARDECVMVLVTEPCAFIVIKPDGGIVYQFGQLSELR